MLACEMRIIFHLDSAKGGSTLLPQYFYFFPRFAVTSSQQMENISSLTTAHVVSL